LREIISCLDIGSYKIKLVIAEILNDSVNVLLSIDEESRGVKNGAIYDTQELEYSITKILKKAEEALGVKITKVITTVNEDSAEFKIGESQIDISDDGEVNSSNIQKALQTSVTGNISQGNELVSVIPIMFKVDDKKTKNPKGMKGDSLQVKSVIVSVVKRDIYTIAKILEHCNVEVMDVMIPSMGSYYAHKNETTDTTTGIVIDCGYDTIKISVFNKGIIINNLVLNAGGINVANDIAYVYKLDHNQAIKLQEKFAYANKRNASSNEIETVINLNGEKVTIDQNKISDIVMHRLHEILNMAKNEINYLTKKEISYIIITGGLTEFKDFSIEVESVFGSLAYIGKIPIVGARDNKYATSIGMIKYFDDKLKLRDKECTMLSEEDIDTLSGATLKEKNNENNVLSKLFNTFFDS